MKIEELANKKVAILGLGVEGIALSKYLIEHKIEFSVIDEKSEEDLQKIGEMWTKTLELLKEKNIKLILGKPVTLEILKNFNVIVRSPGISPFSEVLIQVKVMGSTITSVIKLFFDNCPGKIIGVTGTKGKGTTSALIYEMLKKAGKDAYLGGNIGTAPIEFLDTLTPQSFVVLELSSYQLQDIEVSPHVGVMLMVTQEHLLPDHEGTMQNYHSNIEDYIEAKRNIFRFQTATDMAILNTDYPATYDSKSLVKGQVAFVSRYTPVESGCFVEDNEIIIRWKGIEERVLSVYDVLLAGGHNHENICAAVMAAYSLGVSLDDIRFVLKTFKGLEHRLELIRELDGVRFYDDSFSTVPETAIAAIKAFTSPEILILGGSSKKSNFTELGKIISEGGNIKAIIGIGIEWERIKEQIANVGSIQIIEDLKDMESIVQKAHGLAKTGDVVLLSPGCASFGMFKNYKDRGNQFKEQVNLL